MDPEAYYPMTLPPQSSQWHHHSLKKLRDDSERLIDNGFYQLPHPRCDLKIAYGILLFAFHLQIDATAATL
jgi:hypothetical protein